MADESISRKDHARADLRRRVLTLDLAPAAYLDETELAAEYRMSRPPLREVLRDLAGEGFVVLHPNRGAQVAPMTHTTLRNFFLAAPMIYAATSRLAAAHATPAQVDALKAVQARFRRAIDGGDTAERALMNERFHALIGEMAANEYLMPSLRRLLIDHTRISMTFYDSAAPAFAAERAQAADQHDAFIALIEARDGDGAAALAVEHWELSRSQFERFVTPAPIDAALGRAPELQEAT